MRRVKCTSIDILCLNLHFTVLNYSEMANINVTSLFPTNQVYSSSGPTLNSQNILSNSSKCTVKFSVFIDLTINLGIPSVVNLLIYK